jgi:predicted transcriptional regulator
MKRIQRRDKLKIYGDLLAILYAESNIDKIVLSRVQVKIGVPFDRLKSYISDLKELGLIVEGETFRLTDKGKQYLSEYEDVLDFMKRMGIAYN